MTVVAADDRFYAGFAKLWDLLGTRPLEQGTASLSTLNQHGIRFIQTRIATIDPSERRIETEADSFALTSSWSRSARAQDPSDS